MPNFSSLARLEVPEKFLWGGVGSGVESFYFQIQPCVEVRLGFRQYEKFKKQTNTTGENYAFMIAESYISRKIMEYDFEK